MKTLQTNHLPNSPASRLMLFVLGMVMKRCWACGSVRRVVDGGKGVNTTCSQTKTKPCDALHTCHSSPPSVVSQRPAVAAAAGGVPSWARVRPAVLGQMSVRHDGRGKPVIRDPLLSAPARPSHLVLLLQPAGELGRELVCAVWECSRMGVIVGY